jgi:hypothetical protein
MQAKRFSTIWSVKLTLLLGLLVGIATSWLPSVEGHAQATTPEQAEFFEKKIRPLFAAKCQKCHSADAQVAGLDMSSAEGFARGGESGPLINKALVPGFLTNKR